MKMNCLVIDDEPVARKGMTEYIAEVDFLHLAGQCEHPLKAAALLKEHPVDLVYLDIQMPRLSGIEFLKTLARPPLTILTTAHPDYALESYALDVVDYLLKPITFARFLKASEKAYELFSLKKHTQPTDCFFVKCDNRLERVSFGDVLYIEALQNYVVIHTATRKLIVYLTMAGLEQQLPTDKFLKVHKSFIVSIAQVKAIEGNELLVADARIPISRNQKEEVVKRILGNRLFRR